jgi:hypothetical protein
VLDSTTDALVILCVTHKSPSSGGYLTWQQLLSQLQISGVESFEKAAGQLVWTSAGNRVVVVFEHRRRPMLHHDDRSERACCRTSAVHVTSTRGHPSRMIRRMEGSGFTFQVYADDSVGHAWLSVDR